MPRGPFLRNVSKVGAPSGSISELLFDLAARVADDNADFLNPGAHHRFDSVGHDQLVRDRHELFRAGICDRSEPGSLAAAQNKGLHHAPFI